MLKYWDKKKKETTLLLSLALNPAEGKGRSFYFFSPLSPFCVWSNFPPLPRRRLSDSTSSASQHLPLVTCILSSRFSSSQAGLLSPFLLPTAPLGARYKWGNRKFSERAARTSTLVVVHGKENKTKHATRDAGSCRGNRLGRYCWTAHFGATKPRSRACFRGRGGEQGGKQPSKEFKTMTVFPRGWKNILRGL